MKPWQDINKLEEYRRILVIHYSTTNMNGKIWDFVDENIDVEVHIHMEQQLTLKLFHRILGKDLIVILVYAKYDDVEKLSYGIHYIILPQIWLYLGLLEVTLMSY